MDEREVVILVLLHITTTDATKVFRSIQEVDLPSVVQPLQDRFGVYVKAGQDQIGNQIKNTNFLSF